MRLHYQLDENNIPYSVNTDAPNDLIKWAMSFNEEKRKVARTKIGNGFVSTVFLGIDHRYDFSEDADPILFETMVFNMGWREGFTRRYSFWPEAVAGHNEVVKEATKWMRENGSRNQREGRYMDRIKKRKAKL